MGLNRRLAAAVVGATSLVLVPVPGAAGGAYDDPFFLGWPTFLPAVEGEFTASTENDCPKGSVRCVDNVVREMTRRYNQLACSHQSMFAFTYLLTTEEYRRAVEDPAFFTDNAFVNHQDAVFADYYFRAHDAWRGGQLDEVPPAWRVAFRAGDRREVTGMGNVLLGMNAHVNRDLPFVLHAIGLTKADGTSRKPDHDRVNEFLNAVNKYLLTEAAKYLDPTVDDGDIPGTTIDNTLMVQLLVSWREVAWRNAERLAAASSDGERAAVAQSIENAAANTALLLQSAYRYNGLTNGDAFSRDLYCKANWQAR